MSDKKKYDDWLEVPTPNQNVEQPQEQTQPEYAGWEPVALQKGDRVEIEGEMFTFGGGNPDDPLEYIPDRRDAGEYVGDWLSTTWEGVKRLGSGAKDELVGISPESNPFNIVEGAIDTGFGIASTFGGGATAYIDEKISEFGKTGANDPNDPNQRYKELEETIKLYEDQLLQMGTRGFVPASARKLYQDKIDAAREELSTLEFDQEAQWAYENDPNNPDRPYSEYRADHTYEPRTELGGGALDTLGGVFTPLADAGHEVTRALNKPFAEDERDLKERTARGMAITDPALIAGTPGAIRGIKRGGRAAREGVRTGLENRKIRKADEQIAKADESIATQEAAVEAIREAAGDPASKALAIRHINQSIEALGKGRETIESTRNNVANEQLKRKTNQDVPEVAQIVSALEEISKQTKNRPLRIAVTELLRVAKDKPAVFGGAVIADLGLSAVGVPYPVLTTAVGGGKVLNATRGMLNTAGGIRGLLGEVREAAKAEGFKMPTLQEMVDALPEAARERYVSPEELRKNYPEFEATEGGKTTTTIDRGKPLPEKPKLLPAPKDSGQIPIRVEPTGPEQIGKAPEPIREVEPGTLSKTRAERNKDIAEDLTSETGKAQTILDKITERGNVEKTKKPAEPVKAVPEKSRFDVDQVESAVDRIAQIDKTIKKKNSELGSGNKARDKRLMQDIKYLEAVKEAARLEDIVNKMDATDGMRMVRENQLQKALEDVEAAAKPIDNRSGIHGPRTEQQKAQRAKTREENKKLKDKAKLDDKKLKDMTPEERRAAIAENIKKRDQLTKGSKYTPPKKGPDGTMGMVAKIDEPSFGVWENMTKAERQDYVRRKDVEQRNANEARKNPTFKEIFEEKPKTPSEEALAKIVEKSIFESKIKSDIGGEFYKDITVDSTNVRVGKEPINAETILREVARDARREKQGLDIPEDSPLRTLVDEPTPSMKQTAREDWYNDYKGDEAMVENAARALENWWASGDKRLNATSGEVSGPVKSLSDLVDAARDVYARVNEFDELSMKGKYDKALDESLSAVKADIEANRPKVDEKGKKTLFKTILKSELLGDTIQLVEGKPVTLQYAVEMVKNNVEMIRNTQPSGLQKGLINQFMKKKFKLKPEEMKELLELSESVDLK